MSRADALHFASGGLDTTRVDDLDTTDRDHVAGVKLAQTAVDDLGEDWDTHPDLREVLEALGLRESADATAACGTVARARAHRAAGEPVDALCAAAWVLYRARIKRAGGDVPRTSLPPTEPGGTYTARQAAKARKTRGRPS